MFRKRRVDMTDIEAARLIAQDASSAEIQKMLQAFVFHDSLITLAIVIFQIGSLVAIMRMPETEVSRGVSAPGFYGVMSLAAVAIVLLLRHGRIRQGWVMAIAYATAREREKAQQHDRS